MANSSQKNRPARLKPSGGGNLVAGTQNPDGLLTDMQLMFVKLLVHDNLPKGAAGRMAGYTSKTSVSALMLNPKVQKAIAEARAEYASTTGMTRQKVIDGFVEAIDLGRIKGDPLAMVSGWREIGKMCGFYEPTKTKVEVSVNGRVMVERINSMSDEELLRLAEGDGNVFDGEFSVIEK